MNQLNRNLLKMILKAKSSKNFASLITGLILSISSIHQAEAQNAYPGGGVTRAQGDLTKVITERVRSQVQERARQASKIGIVSDEFEKILPHFEKKIEAGLKEYESKYAQLLQDRELFKAIDTYSQALSTDTLRDKFLENLILNRKKNLDEMILAKSDELDRMILEVYRSLDFPLFYAKVEKKGKKAKILTYRDKGSKVASGKFSTENSGALLADGRFVYAAEEEFQKASKDKILSYLRLSDKNAEYKDLIQLFRKKILEDSLRYPTHSTSDLYGERLSTKEFGIPREFNSFTRIVPFSTKYDPKEAREAFIDFAVDSPSRKTSATCRSQICVSQLSGYLINVLVELRELLHEPTVIRETSEVEKRLGLKPIVLNPSGFAFLPTLQALAEDGPIVSRLNEMKIPVIID
jgi:hypothetical protein